MVSSKKFQTIDEYNETFPDVVRQKLEEVRQAIKRAAPSAEEAISYMIPTFKLNGNLVHFAAFKNHFGFYPAPSGSEAFEKELSNYKQGKINLVFFWLIQIPLSYFMAKIIELEYTGVFWAIFISETSVGVCTLWLFTKGKWKNVEV